jgi:arylsulfatase A-like enzyme
MVLDALPPGCRAETVIVATGDHGESLGEHGESEHGILHDATLHVPLVIQARRSTGHRASTVRHVDLLPLSRLLGESPAPLDGVSLAPLLKGSDRDRSEGPCRTRRAGWRTALRWSPIRSVRDGASYIDAPTPELYQLPMDPRERDNRRDARDGSELAGAGADRRARRGDAVPSESPVKTDVAEKLRSLGYVVDAALSGSSGAGRRGWRGRPQLDALREAMSCIQPGPLQAGDRSRRRG